MKPKEFIAKLDEQRIVSAIAEAERRTSGEIRVYVSHKPRHDVMTAARRRFDKLGMTKTRGRNGVLIFFAPTVRKFAILGDIAIHEKCGDEFWRNISSVMSDELKRGNLTEATLAAVEKVGAVLAQHFPPELRDKNELPNEIAGD
jgi:uncharacterized membrane protein